MTEFGRIDIPDKIMDVRKIGALEFSSIEKVRICNKTVPLVGGGEMIDANVSQLKSTLENIDDWDNIFSELIPPDPSIIKKETITISG